MTKQDVLETETSPRTNPYFTGHAGAEDALLSAWNSKKMPHAWLISGPRGIGKATLAYRLARFVLAGEKNSLLGGELTLSPSHPTFRRIAAGSHGDLLILEMKDGKEINVEEARKIGAFLRLTPSESKWRVVIVDSVDHMNRNAANAILKILEEPPANALILLISHLPGKILPTIRSRCRQLRMKQLGEKAFAEILSRALPEISNDELQKLYHMAEGSPGLAMELRHKSGLEYYATIVDMASRLPRQDSTALHSLGETLASKSEAEAWPVFTYMFGRFFHQLSLHAAGQMQAPLVPHEQEIFSRMLATSPLETWLGQWEKIRPSLEDVTRINLDRKQVIINTFTEMGKVVGR